MVKIELENVTKVFQMGSNSETAVDDIDLVIGDNEFFTLVGPSGCGKSTTLRMLAGLEQPTSGEIYFDGERVTHLPPQKREIAMVFQDVVLFPHMTNRQNMTYGLKVKGDTENLDERVDRIANMLDISDIIDKKPSQISGGQAQRVALGRGIIQDPKVILLDEPMSDLDAKLKIDLRTEIQQIHEEIDSTFVYVTHDQEEAMTMSTTVGVMNNGKLAQVDKPGVIYESPNNRFVAEFIGQPTINTFDTTVTDTGFELNDFGKTIPYDTSQLEIDPTGVTVGVRPNHVRVSDEPVTEWEANIVVFENIGTRYILHLEMAGTPLKASTSQLDVPTLDDVWINGFDKLFLFDDKTGDTIAEIEDLYLSPAPSAVEGSG